MSIQNTTRKTAVMHGNGVSVKFPFAFRINDKEDLKVYVKIGLGPFELKELETDYKLSDVVRDSNNNIISGNIEYPIIIAGEPNQPSPLTSADSIYGIRETPRNQEESSAQVSFKSKDVERALDKATMQIQELTEDVSRTIKVEEWQDIDPEEILDSIFEAEGNCATYERNSEIYSSNAQYWAEDAEEKSYDAHDYANESKKWAEGTDSDVAPLGGTHSAKGWAEQAASIVSSCADKSLSNLNATGEAKFTSKANTSLDNITNTAKANIINLCMPDYTAGVSKTKGTEYTAEKDGIVVFCIKDEHGATMEFLINGTQVFYSGGRDNDARSVDGNFRVRKGDTYQITGGSDTWFYSFYPLKGA